MSEKNNNLKTKKYKNEEEILKFYRKTVAEYSAPVATRLALTKVIEISTESTIIGLSEELKLASAAISEHFTDIPVSSVCELYQVELSHLLGLEGDFGRIKDRLLKKGEESKSLDVKNRRKIAEESRPFFQQGMKIVTFAKSRVVLECFKMARDLSIHVDVLQGGPDEPGKEMVRSLIREGIETRYVPDCGAFAAVSDCDMILVGAVAVTEDGGIINRMGTRTLATVARECSKNFFVAVESLKFSKVFPLSQEHLESTQKVRGVCINTEGLPQNAKVYSSELDFTPPSYITSLWTDIGVKTPGDVSEELLTLFKS